MVLHIIADRGGSDRSGREWWGQAATPFCSVQVRDLWLHSGLRIHGGEVFATCCACVWESVRVATDVFPADTSSKSKRTARYISSYCTGYVSSVTGNFLEVIVERAGETLPEEAGRVDTWERH